MRARGSIAAGAQSTSPPRLPLAAITGYPWGMAGTAALSVTIHVLDVVVIAVLLLLYLLVKVWRRI